jgi:hypothetical protein
MLLIIGAITVVVCVFGGLIMMGGHIEVLTQPFELVIIGGAAAGAFIVGNPDRLSYQPAGHDAGRLSIHGFSARRHASDPFSLDWVLLFAPWYYDLW